MSSSATGSTGARLRLFFAATPDPLAREQIAAASQSLSLEPGARRVPRENYHMTLAFVGDVAASQLPVLLQVGAAQKERAFSVTFDAYEYWRRPAVIVAAAHPIPAELHRSRNRLCCKQCLRLSGACAISVSCAPIRAAFGRRIQ
jgi:2'-5' RNA ligase